MPKSLVIQQDLLLTPFVRRNLNAKKALPAVDRLLGAIAYASEHVLNLVDLSATSPSSNSLRRDWADVVMGHALDLYADAGMEAIAWLQAVGESLFMMMRLLNKEEDIKIQVNGMILEFLPSTHGVSVNDKSGEMFFDGGVLLTMEEVDRQLRNRSCERIWEDTIEISKWMKEPSLPRLSLAVGALQVLVSAGPLSGFQQMTMSGSGLGRVARLEWASAPSTSAVE